MKDIFILGIETSCDDTCAAVLKNNIVLSNIIHSQESHKKYGGIVPEIASREHLCNITTVVDQALSTAKINKNDIDGIAFTQGPGLIGPLFVGSFFAKGLAVALNKPLLAINHLKGHAIACILDNHNVIFPFLCLIISGGNTQLVIVHSYDKIENLGATLDDAVGEAYDKIGKMLGLDYPAGPKIDSYAQTGDIKKFIFPKAKVDGYNFSFSGIKTAFKIFLEKHKNENNFVEKNIEDICASIQDCLLNMLIDKLTIAIHNTGIKRIAIGGGVAANIGLRKMLTSLCNEKNIQLFLPQKQYCTDNAAMIALIGYYKYINKDFSGYDVQVNAKLKLQ